MLFRFMRFPARFEHSNPSKRSVKQKSPFFCIISTNLDVTLVNPLYTNDDFTRITRGARPGLLIVSRAYHILSKIREIEN